MDAFFKLKSPAIATAVLALALVASWVWFLTTQQRMDLQLAVLAAKASNGGNTNGKQSALYKDEAIKSTIRKQSPDIQKLWLAYLDQKPAVAEGSVDVDWHINADGEVLQAALVHSDFTDDALNQGVLKLLQSTRFPPPPGGALTYVVHKFKFKKEQREK